MPWEDLSTDVESEFAGLTQFDFKEISRNNPGRAMRVLGRGPVVHPDGWVDGRCAIARARKRGHAHYTLRRAACAGQGRASQRGRVLRWAPARSDGRALTAPSE